MTLYDNPLPVADYPAYLGYDWGEGGADVMILLYEPVNRIALMTFDYT